MSGRIEPTVARADPRQRDLGLGFSLVPAAGLAIADEDGDLVMSRPGLTAWICVVENAEGSDVATRLEQVRSEQRTRARDIRERTDDGLLRYAYRDVEDDEYGRLRTIVRGFVFGRLGHVEVLAHPGSEDDVEAAYALVDAVGLDAQALADALLARVVEGDPFAGARYLVERAANSLSTTNAYRVRDGIGGVMLLEGREPALGASVDLTRLLGRGRILTRFKVVLRTLDGAVALTLRRGFARPIGMVEVLDGAGAPLGRIKPRWYSLFGTHDILDAHGGRIARLRIAWPGGDARIDRGGTELARVARARGGFLGGDATGGDELTIAPTVAADDPLRRLLVATAVYLDLRTKD